MLLSFLHRGLRRRLMWIEESNGEERRGNYRFLIFLEYNVGTCSLNIIRPVVLMCICDWDWSLFFVYDIRAGWLVKKLKTKKKKSMAKRKQTITASETPRTLFYSPFIFFGAGAQLSPYQPLYVYPTMLSPGCFCPTS